MALGAVLGAALNTHAAHPLALYLGGMDVIPAFDAPHTGPAAPVETISLSEQGPGGVSSLSFDLEDPSASYQLVDGMDVSMWDLIANVPIFTGTVDTWTASPWGTIRTLHVSASGIEKRLDDIKVQPAATIGSLFNLDAAIALLMAQLAWHGLNVTTGSVDAGNAAQPVGRLGQVVDGALAIPYLFGNATLSGTVRQGILDLAAIASYHGVLGTVVPCPILVTVDFSGGLRVWLDAPGNDPADYSTLTVSNAVAGTASASAFSYEQDPADVPHAVYMQGSGVAGWYYDGTGIRGRQDVVTSPATTTDQLAQAAAQYFASQSASLRGTFRLESSSVTDPTIHAGSLVVINDAVAGVSGTFRIFAIDKRFHGDGGQDWTVSFGGRRPSAVSLMRRYTRGTLA